MKDRVYKHPVSILVVIYAQDTKRVLMLQRRDDPDLWQSVTDSVKGGETVPQVAMREIREEVAVDAVAEQLALISHWHTAEFEISSHLHHRYAPDATRNTESWFCLVLPYERQIVFTEHLAYRWLNAPAAAVLTKP